MPLTFTGRNVTHTDGVPSLIDIAVGLCRQPRFGGQCRRWWSVLDHTLFCDDLVVADGGGSHARLALLLHDAHECLTADVPTPFKGLEMSELQSKLDARIFREYLPGGIDTYLNHCVTVHEIDKRAMRAEARLVGPPDIDKHLDSFGITSATEPQVANDMVVLRRELGRAAYLAYPPAILDPVEHPGVTEFLSRILHLR